MILLGKVDLIPGYISPNVIFILPGILKLMQESRYVHQCCTVMK